MSRMEGTVENIIEARGELENALRAVRKIRYLGIMKLLSVDLGPIEQQLVAMVEVFGGNSREYT